MCDEELMPTDPLCITYLPYDFAEIEKKLEHVDWKTVHRLRREQPILQEIKYELDFTEVDND